MASLEPAKPPERSLPPAPLAFPPGREGFPVEGRYEFPPRAKLPVFPDGRANDDPPRETLGAEGARNDPLLLPRKPPPPPKPPPWNPPPPPREPPPPPP